MNGFQKAAYDRQVERKNPETHYPNADEIERYKKDKETSVLADEGPDL